MLARMGGVARWKELLAEGVSRTRLRDAVETGAVVRVHLGVYALPEASREKTHASIFRGELACLSLCAALRLPFLVQPATTHLLLPRSRSNSRPGVRTLETVTLHRLSDRVPRPTVTAAALAIDLAGECTAGPQQLALVDAALNRGLLTRAELRNFSITSPVRRAWLDRHASALAESIIETLSRLAITTAGLEVAPQVRIAGVGRVDLLVEGFLVVELDGRAYHSDDRQFSADRRRDRLLVQAGFTVLRFTYDDVVNAPGAMVATILAVVGSRSLRSAPTL